MMASDFGSQVIYSNAENVDYDQDVNVKVENEEKPANLIVNYLPQTLTDEEFHNMFAAVGTVLSSKIIRDRDTNYSHGYGFVEYATSTEAQTAIDSLNGLPLQHKTIKVAFARPSSGGNKNTNLYIQGIPPTMTKEALEEIFQPYGEIINTRVLLKADMTAKGDGFVLFENEQSANSALDDLNGQTLPGGNRPMQIKFAMENKRQQAQQQQGGGAGGKYPPPPPPGGRGGRGGAGGGGGGFGGPMRNRGGQQQNRFNPMQQRGGGGRGGGGGGGFRGGRGGGGGGWRGGQNNGSGNGFGADDGSYFDQGFGGGAGGFEDGGFGGGYDQTGYDETGGFGQQGFDQGYGGGGEEFYDQSQGGQGFQEYPENGYQGYYDAMSFQGYEMPGQQSRGRGRGRGGPGGGLGGPRGGAGGGAPRGAPRGGRGGLGGAPRGAPRGGRGAPRGGPRGGAAGGGSFAAPGATGIALYVYNIGPNATEEDVMTIFSHYGSVVKVDVIMDYEKNVTKNYAFVHMSTDEEAGTAISALNERYCMRPNHPMQVRYHQAKAKKPQQ